MIINAKQLLISIVLAAAPGVGAQSALNVIGATQAANRWLKVLGPYGVGLMATPLAVKSVGFADAEADAQVRAIKMLRVKSMLEIPEIEEEHTRLKES